MANSVNKVIIVGTLGRDPEVKSFANGGRVANLKVATSEQWKDRETGEKKERTEWHSVTLNGDGLVNVAERYLKKGSKVYIEGQLQTRKWQDQSGQDRYTTEIVVRGFNGSIVMLGGGQAGSENKPAQPAQEQKKLNSYGDDNPFGDDPFGLDEIPF